MKTSRTLLRLFRPSRIDLLIVAYLLPFAVALAAYFATDEIDAKSSLFRNAFWMVSLGLFLGVVGPLLSAATFSRLSVSEKFVALFVGCGSCWFVTILVLVENANGRYPSISYSLRYAGFDLEKGWTVSNSMAGFLGVVLAMGLLTQPIVTRVIDFLVGLQFSRQKWLIWIAGSMFVFAFVMNNFGGLTLFDRYCKFADLNRSDLMVWVFHSILFGIAIVHFPCIVYWKIRSRYLWALFQFLFIAVLFMLLSWTKWMVQTVMPWSLAAYCLGQVFSLSLLHPYAGQSELSKAPVNRLGNSWGIAVARCSPLIAIVLFTTWLAFRTDKFVLVHSRSMDEVGLAFNLRQFKENSRSQIDVYLTSPRQLAVEFSRNRMVSTQSRAFQSDVAFYSMGDKRPAGSNPVQLSGLDQIAPYIYIGDFEGIDLDDNIRSLESAPILSLWDSRITPGDFRSILKRKDRVLLDRVEIVDDGDSVRETISVVSQLLVAGDKPGMIARMLDQIDEKSSIGKLRIEGFIGLGDWEQILRFAKVGWVSVCATQMQIDDRLIAALNQSDPKFLLLTVAEHCSPSCIEVRTEIIEKTAQSVPFAYMSWHRVLGAGERSKWTNSDVVRIWRRWILKENLDSFDWLDYAFSQLTNSNRGNIFGLQFAKEMGWVYGGDQKNGSKLKVWLPFWMFLDFVKDEELHRIEVVSFDTSWIGRSRGVALIDAQFLGKLTRIKSMHLGYFDIEPDCLARMPLLAELEMSSNLSKTRVGEFLRAASKLKKLTIGYDPSFEGVTEIGQLEALNLIVDTTTFVDSDLTRLKEKFPNVEISVVGDLTIGTPIPNEFLEHLENYRKKIREEK